MKTNPPLPIDWHLLNNSICTDIVILALVILILAKAREIWRRK